MKIAFVGFGGVGQALAEILEDKKKYYPNNMV